VAQPENAGAVSIDEEVCMPGLVLTALLGIAAGAITTVAGMGGGLLLLLALATATSPLHALAVTAPALLLGNLHRVVLYRRELEPRTAGALVLGAVPGSVIGGLLATQLPETVLRLLMVALAGLAIARAAGWLRWTPPAVASAPVGFVTGLITATSRGAGVLVAPFLLARGLRGAAYVGTMACGAVAMHAGRMVAYGAGGVLDARVVLQGAALAVAILGGNLVGDRVRRALGARAQGRVQLAVLLTTAALAVGGLA
jgi:uncharacterized membrane protein YfcA